jgi:hypothetical protein
VQSRGFSEITQCPYVQRRIRFARETWEQGNQRLTLDSDVYKYCQRLSRETPTVSREMVAVMPCFGGDISTLHAFGFSRAVAFDIQPVFCEKKMEADDQVHLSWAMQIKYLRGHLGNEDALAFDEIAPFCFFDIFAIGGENIRVFQSVSNSALYEIRFRIEGVEKIVRIAQKCITAKDNLRMMLRKAEESPDQPVAVLLKAGEFPAAKSLGDVLVGRYRAAVYGAYRAIGNSFGDLLDGSAVFSDKPLGDLKPFGLARWKIGRRWSMSLVDVALPGAYGYSPHGAWLFEKT